MNTELNIEQNQGLSDEELFTKEQLYSCALHFFHYWWNIKGHNNTAEGLQRWLPDWIKGNPPKQYASSIHEEKFSQLLEQYIFYSKAEKICQEVYFDEIGIPSGQTFEQRVTAVIRMLLEYQRQGTHSKLPNQ